MGGGPVDFHIRFTSSAGEGDLVALQGATDGATIDTHFARVTLHRRAGTEGLRLEVTPVAGGAVPPRPQAQLNPVAESVARQLELTEAWVAVLAESGIILGGSAAEPCCSVTIPDAAMRARGVTDLEGLRATAENIVVGVLIALLRVAVSPVSRN